jgi:diguanylate cyclase (GGDEF)-like protein
MAFVDKQQIKQHGILMAGTGLVLVLAVGCLLHYFGFQAIPLDKCLLALAATVAVEGACWLTVRQKWDGRLASWDPHFVYVPMVAATALFTLYIYLAPSMRVVLLMAWFGAPILMAGLVGFAGLFAMSALMALSYLGAIALLIRQGASLTMSFESAVATMFILINVYTGVVFERLRRQREERKVLRARLAELAITDPLTGLYNRRHFEDILRAEVSRIQRYGGNCSLAMIDLDFFKNYNDTLGHLAGDALLRELGALLRSHLRLSDVLARYGGEEFGLIMINTPKDEAILAMERLRSLVEEYPFRGGSIQPFGRLTVSCGIASCPADGVDYEELVHKADGALYAAKRMGRNQVQVALLA